MKNHLLKLLLLQGIKVCKPTHPQHYIKLEVEMSGILAKVMLNKLNNKVEFVYGSEQPTDNNNLGHLIDLNLPLVSPDEDYREGSGSTALKKRNDAPSVADTTWRFEKMEPGQYVPTRNFDNRVFKFFPAKLPSKLLFFWPKSSSPRLYVEHQLLQGVILNNNGKSIVGHPLDKQVFVKPAINDFGTLLAKITLILPGQPPPPRPTKFRCDCTDKRELPFIEFTLPEDEIKYEFTKDEYIVRKSNLDDTNFCYLAIEPYNGASRVWKIGAAFARGYPTKIWRQNPGGTMMFGFLPKKE